MSRLSYVPQYQLCTKSEYRPQQSLKHPAKTTDWQISPLIKTYPNKCCTDLMASYIYRIFRSGSRLWPKYLLFGWTGFPLPCSREEIPSGTPNGRSRTTFEERRGSFEDTCPKSNERQVAYSAHRIRRLITYHFRTLFMSFEIILRS